MTGDIFTFLILATILFNVGMLVLLERNRQTAAWMRELIEICRQLSLEDERAGRPWKWRLESLDSVPYRLVALTPWLTLHPANYWKDLSFLVPGGLDGIETD